MEEIPRANKQPPRNALLAQEKNDGFTDDHVTFGDTEAPKLK